MNTLLHINASIFSEGGQSSQLSQEFVTEWLRQHPSGRVIKRDLVAAALPHLDAERFLALISKPEERTERQAQIVAESDALISEIQQADVVVMGLPMYNFTLPTQLKSYFDHIARAGVTFKYTETGPVGLLTNKRVVIFATRGGFYAGTPADTQTGLVKTLFGFLGVTDIEFVYVEGISVSAEKKAEAIANAKEKIPSLVA